MGLKRVIGPAIEPVTLAEAKAHLRVDHDDDDALISSLIQAAREHAERFLGRALIEQTWELYLDAFPETGPIELAICPVIDVIGVFYGDDSPETELAPSAYKVDTASEPARIALIGGGAWPAVTDGQNVVRVRFTAGYSPEDESPQGASVPEKFKAAIKIALGTLYEHRESVVVGAPVAEMPFAFEALLKPDRLHKGMA